LTKAELERQFLFIEQTAAAFIVINAWRRYQLRIQFKLFFIQNCFTKMEKKAMQSCKAVLRTFMKPEILAAWSKKPTYLQANS
jgi:hypothetical protein